MSEEQHAKLEAHRVRLGLRSLNAAMLHLIDQPRPIAYTAKLPDSAPIGTVVTREHPAAKPFKSRLKGEWKAP